MPCCPNCKSIYFTTLDRERHLLQEVEYVCTECGFKWGRDD